MVCLICCISNHEPSKLKRRKIDRLSIGLPQDFRHINHVGSGDTSNNTSMSSLTQRLQDVDSDQGNVTGCPISPLLLNCIDLTVVKDKQNFNIIHSSNSQDDQAPQSNNCINLSNKDISQCPNISINNSRFHDEDDRRMLTRNWVSVTDLPPPPVPPVVVEE